MGEFDCVIPFLNIVEANPAKVRRMARLPIERQRKRKMSAVKFTSLWFPTGCCSTSIRTDEVCQLSRAHVPLGIVHGVAVAGLTYLSLALALSVSCFGSSVPRLRISR